MTNTAQGDEPLPALTDDHHVVALASFRRLGLNLHDAEDCAQATMLRVHSALGRYEPRAPLSAFVRRVTHSVYADWCRWRRVRRADQALGNLTDAHETAAPMPVDAGHLLDLQAAVATLPPKLAAVVALAVDQGLAYREVSERLGIPVGTVKSRMFLAVQHLRTELDHES